MVLVPLANTHRFSAAILGHEFLKTERHPDIEKTEARHDSKPVSSIVNIARSVVPVKRKHTTNRNSPFQGFEGRLEFENVFQF